ncbi:leucine-rich repeat protein FLOR 1 isoform X2 [Cryptomeria japonica]|uniref:leucine-rich repeat protein FLOR 1 isoform X2 n=1 Tax=Cryptomeria japonica TaxID=3369 RepID=UPI0025AD24C6|nr:leucine-rich repeat protein FLOR 1 isoform X2 [Cryptomeria japonica]
MAISLRKLCLVITSVFVVLLPCPRPSLSLGLMSNRCPSHESEALLRFKAALNESKVYPTLSSWVNVTDCCSVWNGISCNNHTNHVVSVVVSVVDGSVISESLCQLRFLTLLGIKGATGICFWLGLFLTEDMLVL